MLYLGKEKLPCDILRKDWAVEKNDMIVSCIVKYENLYELFVVLNKCF